jgi:hypothetical protein
MKKGIFNFVIFMMFLYLINRYISYYQLEFILPQDLFRYPYRDMAATEVTLWKFSLKWIVPGIIVFYLMWLTKISNNIPYTWGMTLVGIAIFINIIFSFVKAFLLYLAAQSPGGGMLFAVGKYLNLFEIYSSFPLGLVLVIGTLKVLISIKPDAMKSNPDQS